MLDADAQIAHAEQLKAGLSGIIGDLETYKVGQDPFEAEQVELAIELQKLRLRWLDTKLKTLQSTA